MKSAPCAEQPTTTSSAVKFRSGANAASKDSTFRSTSCADCTDGGTRNGGGARAPTLLVCQFSVKGDAFSHELSEVVDEIAAVLGSIDEPEAAARSASWMWPQARSAGTPPN